MSDIQDGEGAKQMQVAEPVTHKEFFTRAWQLAGFTFLVGVFVWQLVGRDVSRVEARVDQLDAKLIKVDDRVQSVERSVYELKTDLKSMDQKLDRMQQTLDDIASRVGAGAIGGPYKPKKR